MTQLIASKLHIKIKLKLGSNIAYILGVSIVGIIGTNLGERLDIRLRLIRGIGVGDMIGIMGIAIGICLGNIGDNICLKLRDSFERI